MSRVDLSAELWHEFAAVARGSGCELLDCGFKGGLLRLVIDRPEGVTLSDCETVSKQISAILDVADFPSQRYLLEVSSPGLDRKFYNAEDYQRFCGRQVRITWKDPAMEHKATVIGKLESYSSASEAITLGDCPGGKRYTILLKNIELARLEPEL